MAVYHRICILRRKFQCGWVSHYTQVCNPIAFCSRFHLGSLSLRNVFRNRDEACQVKVARYKVGQTIYIWRRRSRRRGAASAREEVVWRRSRKILTESRRHQTCYRCTNVFLLQDTASTTAVHLEYFYAKKIHSCVT